jgi:hypothetical protein
LQDQQIQQQKPIQIISSTNGKILDIKTKMLIEKLEKIKDVVRLADEKLKQAHEAVKQQMQPHESENPDEKEWQESNDQSDIGQNHQIEIIGEDFQ